MTHIVLGLRLFVAIVVFCVGALIVWLLNILTRGASQRFCRERLLGTFSSALMKLFGIKLNVEDRHGVSGARQVVYVANHSSTLDIFILCALGLENTRFFLGRKTRKILPLAMLGDGTGAFFVPLQTDPEGRSQCFQNACRVLQETRESVFLTPEGTRVTGGQIGKFNKGAFHLAIALGVPIVPIFIGIPPKMNPGKGLGIRPGTIKITLHPAIATTHWSLATLDKHLNEVRDLYVYWNDVLMSSAQEQELRVSKVEMSPEKVGAM